MITSSVGFRPDQADCAKKFQQLHPGGSTAAKIGVLKSRQGQTITKPLGGRVVGFSSNIA